MRRDDCDHLDITSLEDGVWECNDCGSELTADDLPEEVTSPNYAINTGDECPDCGEQTHYDERSDEEYCADCGWTE